jgi:hypothetical protein
LFLESNADAVRHAQRDGFRVIYGNALEDSTLQRAALEDTEACIMLTANEEINLLVTRLVRRDYKVPRAYIILGGSLTRNVISETDGLILFGGPQDIGLWCARVRRRIVSEYHWTCARAESGLWPTSASIPDTLENAILPIAVCRSGKATPFHEGISVKKGDQLATLILSEKSESVVLWMLNQGWIQDVPAPPSTNSQNDQRRL